MRVLVSHDYVAPKSWRWQAMPCEFDLGVPVGHGSTPLRAIADLLCWLDVEDIEPEQVEIVWTD